MKKRKKWIYALGALLLLAPMAGLLAINLYIQSPAFRTNIEKTLARNLHLYLHIEEITFAPWSGLRATAESLTAEGKPVADAPKTKLAGDLELIPLLNGRIILNKVTLYDPRAEWVLGMPADLPAAGSSSASFRAHAPWRLASIMPLAAAPAGETQIAPPAGIRQDPGPSASAAAEDSAAAAPSESPARSVHITGIRVERGELVLREVGQPELAIFHGITLDAVSGAAGEYDGTVDVQDALILGQIPLQHLSTRVRYRSGLVEFPDISSAMAGGTLTGSLTFREVKKRMQFATDLDFYDIKLSAIAPKEDERMKFESGELEGGIRMEGDVEQWEEASGTAELIITDAAFSRDSVISRIGTLLKIQELSNLAADRVWLSGRLDKGVFTIEKGELKSDSVLLTAGGTVEREAKLRLDAKLHISDQMIRKIPDYLTKELRPSNVEGFKQIGFVVRGRVNKVRTDLVDRLFPAREPFGLILRSFFPEQTRLLPEDMDTPPAGAPAPADGGVQAPAGDAGTPAPVPSAPPATPIATQALKGSSAAPVAPAMSAPVPARPAMSDEAAAATPAPAPGLVAPADAPPTQAPPSAPVPDPAPATAP